MKNDPTLPRWLRNALTIMAFLMLSPILGLLGIFTLGVMAPVAIVALPFMVPVFFTGACADSNCLEAVATLWPRGQPVRLAA